MKVVIGKSKNRGTFNKNSVTQTSSSIGFIQPTKMIPYTPHADITIDAGAKVRLNTLVTSTFGQMALHQYFGTIDADDIWKPWNHFRNGLPYAYVDQTVVPEYAPNYNMVRLFLTMIGKYDVDGHISRCINLYQSVKDGTFYSDTDTVIVGLEDPRSAGLDMWNEIDNTREYPLCAWLAQALYCRSLDSTFDASDFIDTRPQDLSVTSASAYDFALINGANPALISIVSTPIGDCYRYDSAFIIKLGQFGKKLRKIFKGLGFNIDGYLNPLMFEGQLDSEHGCGQTLPLLAYAKFIYDSQAIKRYADYDQTYLCKHITALNTYSTFNAIKYRGSDVNMSDLTILDTLSVFDCDKSFGVEYKGEYGYLAQLHAVLCELLVNSFYTIEPDMYSSTNDTVGLSYGQSFDLFAVVQDSDTQDFVSADHDEVLSNNPASYVLTHIAQKLQHMVNRMNVLGASLYKRSKELLGVDPDNETTLRSHFVGRYITPIQISDEMGTSGDNLGQLGGKGLGSNRLPGKLHFKSNQYGYLFAVCCIVPRIGTFQGTSGEYNRFERYDFPTPDFDSLGYVPQASSLLYSGATSANGVQPRYFDFKFDNDIVNGDFDLLSNYTNMSPYWYQRIFNGQVLRNIQRGVFAHSDIYRRIGQHEDTGHFNRIFVNKDPLYDNFFISIGFEITTKEDLLPISESWDTVDDDERTDATSKA